MKSIRRHHILERDRSRIERQILEGRKRCTAGDFIDFPDALRGDDQEVLKKCASTGYQKWPVTRKWRPDETLIQKGYKELEFHSRCNFVPTIPECEQRNYLIGPREFVEMDKKKYGEEVFDEDVLDDDSHCTVVRVRSFTRRLTSVEQRFIEVPDGYTKPPVVREQTWDVKFIPKKYRQTEGDEPKFVSVKNVTLDGMMELYKYAESFYVEKTNKERFITKRKRRLSYVLGNEKMLSRSIRSSRTRTDSIFFDNPKALSETQLSLMQLLEAKLTPKELSKLLKQHKELSNIQVNQILGLHEMFQVDNMSEIMYPHGTLSKVQLTNMLHKQEGMTKDQLLMMFEAGKVLSPAQILDMAESMKDESKTHLIHAMQKRGLIPEDEAQSLLGLEKELTKEQLILVLSATRSISPPLCEKMLESEKFKKEQALKAQSEKEYLPPPSRIFTPPSESFIASDLKKTTTQETLKNLSTIDEAPVQSSSDKYKEFYKDLQEWKRVIPTHLFNEAVPKDAQVSRKEAISKQWQAVQKERAKSEDKYAKQRFEKKVLKTRTSSADDLFVGLVVGEDVRSHSSEEKRKPLVPNEKDIPRQYLCVPTAQGMECTVVNLTSDVKEDTKKEMKKDEKRASKKDIPIPFRPVKKDNLSQKVMSLPDYEMSGIRKEKAPSSVQKEKKKKEKKEKESKEKKQPKEPKEQKSGPKLERKTEDKVEYSRQIRRFSTDDATPAATTSMAWSRKRAAGKLKMDQATGKKSTTAKMPTTLEGTLKPMHDPDDEPAPSSTTYRASPAKKKVTPKEEEMSEVTPLSLHQFGRTPTFEERGQDLLKKARQKKKEKRGKMLVKLKDEETADTVIVEKAPNKKKYEGHQSKNLLSKLELFKKGKGDKDLTDFKKGEPIDENKSPFQFGQGHLDDGKRQKDVQDVVAKSPNYSEASFYDEILDEQKRNGGVTRVGDLEMLEKSGTSSRNKLKERDLDKSKTDGKFHFFGAHRAPTRTQKTSMRSKYGLYQSAYFQDGSRSSISQDVTSTVQDDAYSFVKVPTTQYASGMPDSGIVTRFVYPMHLSALEDMTPMEYLNEYTTIAPRRLGVYQTIFKKYAVRNVIPMTIMRNALQQLLVGPLIRDDFFSILRLVERGLAKSFDWDEFKLICCLTERLIDETTPKTAMAPMTDYLQIADSSTILSVLREQASNIPLTKLLSSIANCSLHY